MLKEDLCNHTKSSVAFSDDDDERIKKQAKIAIFIWISLIFVTKTWPTFISTNELRPYKHVTQATHVVEETRNKSDEKANTTSIVIDINCVTKDK